MGSSQQRAFKEDRSQADLESPAGLIVEEIDLSITTLSLNLDPDGEKETTTAKASSLTSEELSSRIKERENEISRLRETEVLNLKVAERLSKTVEEITQSQNSTEESSKKIDWVADLTIGGAIFVVVPGAVGAVLGTFVAAGVGSSGPGPAIWGAILGAALTLPSFITVHWLKITKPFSSDYEEFKGVCKRIEGVAEEERLTPEYRLKLYAEAAELYKKKQKKVEQEISDLQKANSADQKVIDKFIEEDKGKLPDRFKNAKIKLGIEQGELLPSPSEIKAKAKLLWSDEGRKSSDM